jgi:hypothetical protein
MPGANGTPPGYGQPGNIINTQAQGANQAQQMIQQILTTPRPGGMPGATGGPTMGGGIAGFASTADSEGIMVYNDRTNYKEWEFVFDLTKFKNPPNPLNGSNGGVGTPASQLGNIGGSPIGTPAANMPGASGFGQPGGGFGQPGGFGMGPTGPGVTPPRQQQ